jgi:hypothetical protein
MPAISLKAAMGAVAVAALLFNTAYAYTIISGVGGKGGWLGDTGTGEGDDLGDLTVSVPPAKLYDLITYDSEVFAEMYYKNMSSGQWEDYQLKITGQLKRSYPGVVEARDGFWVPHQCVEYDTETTATFTISISSSDGTPLTIGGNLEVKRKEYIELNSKRPIDAYTQAEVNIDRLPRYNVPLSFSGWIDAYADPNKQLDDTVDGRIFSDGQTIKRGDNGTFVLQQIYEDYGFIMGTRYNWSAEAAQKISNLKALRINITASLFGAETGGNATSEDWLKFNETVWISSDCPFPVKRYSLNDQTYEDTDRSGNVQVSRFVMEISNTLIQNGYSRGTTQIPWGDPGAVEFSKVHPRGELTGWQYTPSDGAGIQSSSFDLGIEQAVNEALTNSTGLQDFIGKYNRPQVRTPFVDWASYNFTPDPTDLSGQAGLYRWNLSFGVFPDRNESYEARQTNTSNFRYSVVVVDNVTKEIERLRTVYKHRVYIENDWGPQRGSASFKREMLSSQGCTLASSEGIMMLDPTIQSSVTNSRTGDIDWKESTYSLGAAGMGSASPGLSMVQTLTGMTFPSVDYAWAVQTQTVYEQGHTFGAAVDVETGQLVYAMDISGTALLGIFG